MKKYKLQDLVSNGSRARREVQSDVLVGDPSNGYGYGDILDANATKELVDEKIQDHTTVVIEGVESTFQDLQNKDEELEQKIIVIENTIGTVPASFDGDGTITIGL